MAVNIRPRLPEFILLALLCGTFAAFAFFVGRDMLDPNWHPPQHCRKFCFIDNFLYSLPPWQRFGIASFYTAIFLLSAIHSVLFCIWRNSFVRLDENTIQFRYRWCKRSLQWSDVTWIDCVRLFGTGGEQGGVRMFVANKILRRRNNLPFGLLLDPDRFDFNVRDILWLAYKMRPDLCQNLLQQALESGLVEKPPTEGICPQSALD
jgi:hypothetical protein